MIYTTAPYWKYNKTKSFSPRKKLFLCINITIIFKHFTIFSLYCFSHSFWHHAKDKYGRQKYICHKCHHQFTLKPNKIKTSDKSYQKCPVCSIILLLGTNMTFIFILSVILKSLDIPLNFLLYNWSFVKRSFLLLPRFVLKHFVLHQIIYSYTLLWGLLLSQTDTKLMEEAYVCLCFSRFYLSVNSSFCSFFQIRFLLQKADLHSDQWHADETDIKIKG